MTNPTQPAWSRAAVWLGTYLADGRESVVRLREAATAAGFGVASLIAALTEIKATASNKGEAFELDQAALAYWKKYVAETRAMALLNVGNSPVPATSATTTKQAPMPPTVTYKPKHNISAEFVAHLEREVARNAGAVPAQPAPQAIDRAVDIFARRRKAAGRA